MENSSFIFTKSENAYEIMSRMDYDIYFEMEILCDDVKEIMAQLKSREMEVLTNTYLHQCRFLVEHVLDYVRYHRKTTVHFIKNADQGTSNICKIIHMKEVEESQAMMKDVFKKFKDAAYFIFPGNYYPEYLFCLKEKMMFIDIIMTDLFYLEKTKLIPRKVKKQSNELKFQDISMN